MKRLVCHFAFFIFLITAFTFSATATYAIVEIAVTGEYTPDDTGTTQDDTEIVVRLTYNTEPDPKPTADDITFTPDTGVTFGEGDDSDSKTYAITWTELGGDLDRTFQLRGYLNVNVLGTLDSNSDPIVTFTGLLANKLTNDHDAFVPGLGYAIVAANNTDIGSGVFPTLPSINPPNDIVKISWTDVSDEPTLPGIGMPDLFELFTGGGSLNLRVNEPGSNNRLGSMKDDGTYDDEHGRNQRQLVINEVMWAHDQGFLGNPTSLVAEQWIELYNQTTTPIMFSQIEFTTDKTDPGPPPETDLLSNIPNFEITWEIDTKGRHGSSVSPRREFQSMQRDDYENGWEPDHWSTATTLFQNNYRGTPGKRNQKPSVRPPRARPSQDSPAKNKIIINEIGNFTDDTTDWIELLNLTNSDQYLAEWALTITTGFGHEEEIIRFPSTSDVYIPARGVLLLVNEDPQRTPLSAGYDISLEDVDQAFGAGIHEYLIVDDDKIAIPNDDKWLLILRDNEPWDVGDSRDVYQTGFHVQDVAGPGALHDDFQILTFTKPLPSYEKKSNGRENGQIWDTKVFPLNGNKQQDGDFLQSGILDTAGKVWARDDSKQGYLKDAWKKVGYTGIGYDRAVRINDHHGGTPGYANDVAKEKLAQLDGGRLIVNELMLTSGSRGAPQWIELYNTSKTRAIDFAADSSDPKTGWQLIVENHNSGVWDEERRNLNIKVNLKDLFPYGIPPNQSVLIVSAKGRASNSDYFPASRVAGIFEKKKSDFGLTSRRDQFLNAEGGFYISIVDGDGTISDEIGNLDGVAVDLRQGIEFDNPYSWDWSTELTEEGYRTSLIRLNDQSGRPRIAIPDRTVEGSLRGAVLPMGMNQRPAGYAWVHAVDTAFERVRYREIWYGSDTDISTPGFIRGTPLPVSLSFFRPSLENGEVVIRWTTESEVDNAGFNILRSNNRSGEFTQVNSALIQGAGTSSERNTYKWVDTTAKQGVIYYYQIEDVSYAGERQLLTTTRLKGMISPRSKLTTTWSQLKTLR